MSIPGYCPYCATFGDSCECGIAVLTRAGTSSHGAWCEPCQDGIHNTTKRRAVDWLTRHNNRWHRQPQPNP